MKKFYETTFMVNASIDDDQIENTIRQSEDIIIKNGGEIVSIDRIGRKRLAYPIQKKHTGFYCSIEFNAEGRIIDKIERFFQLDDNVLRYLTITLNKRQLEAKRQREILTREILESKEEDLIDIPKPDLEIENKP